MARQGGRATGRLADFRCAFGRWTPGRKIGQQHFALAEDGRENAVKLVRDSARKFAHRLQFLRLKELGFELFARGDVAGDARQPDHLACGIPDLKTAAVNPSQLTVRSGYLKLFAHARFARHKLSKSGKDTVPFLRHYRIGPFVWMLTCVCGPNDPTPVRRRD